MKYLFIACILLSACDSPTTESKVENKVEEKVEDVKKEFDTLKQDAKPVIDTIGKKLDKAGEKIEKGAEKVEEGAKKLNRKVKEEL